MKTQNITSTIGQLRDILDTELENMLAWRNSPKVRANMYTRHEIGLLEHLSWWSSIKADPSFEYFMYEFEGKGCGIVGFSQIDKESKTADWAFYASPTAPKGTGRRMEFLALEHAFMNLQLNKLSCEVLAFNLAVVNMHKNFGFQIEGNFRQQHKYDDKYVDVIRFGILKTEWRSIRAEILGKISE